MSATESVTSVPGAKLAEQVAWQSMPAGWLRTLPAPSTPSTVRTNPPPVPLSVTVEAGRGRFWWTTKVAVRGPTTRGVKVTSMPQRPPGSIEAQPSPGLAW